MPQTCLEVSDLFICLFLLLLSAHLKTYLMKLTILCMDLRDNVSMTGGSVSYVAGLWSFAMTIYVPWSVSIQSSSSHEVLRG